jgi:hypothetical protein
MGIEAYLSNQLSLLSNSIGATDFPTAPSRYIGGHNRENQPFITGYHQILVQLPSKIFGSSSANATKWLSSTCESFTPHSTTTNLVDVMGIGQIGSSFPASKTVNREFTLAFREYQSLPILNIFRTWNSLFDSHLGISTLSAADFIPVSYKGAITVALLKPTASGTNKTITAEDIEEIYMYEGVYPTTVPEDTIAAADQGTNDTIQASVTFRFDGAPIDKANNDLINYFVNMMTDNKYNSVYDRIGTSFS